MQPSNMLKPKKSEIRFMVPTTLKNDMLDHIGMVGRYRTMSHFLQEAVEEKLAREKHLAEKAKEEFAVKHGIFKMVKEP
jgi:Arc/MetJ-type ribon-helix-helix transcriptional regulator